MPNELVPPDYDRYFSRHNPGFVVPMAAVILVLVGIIANTEGCKKMHGLGEKASQTTCGESQTRQMGK